MKCNCRTCELSGQNEIVEPKLLTRHLIQPEERLILSNDIFTLSFYGDKQFDYYSIKVEGVKHEQ